MTKKHAKLETIVAGTSLDIASDRVVQRAVALAQASGAKLYLVHAHALPMAVYGAISGLTTVEPDLLLAEGQVRKELLTQQLERVGLSLESIAGSVIEAGAPHRIVLDAAHEHQADLIVIGGTREGFHLLGSTADRVLRKATCPVWIVGANVSLEPDCWLAPVDLSPLAAECLEHGLAILHQAGVGRRLESLFVLTADDLEAEPVADSEAYAAEVVTADALAGLQRFLEKIPGVGDCQAQVRIGDVRAEILRHAAELDASLVLGTHGRSGFERFLLGSVAADLAAKAHRDVLIVPPSAAREEKAG